MKNKNVEKIMIDLSYFTGTENYYQYNLPNKQKFFLTDGVKYLCEHCGCYWLVDYIISLQQHHLVKEQQFQYWKLYLLDKTWNINCEDGNKKVLYHGTISYSDFPLNGITVYCIDGYILLPSEY